MLLIPLPLSASRGDQIHNAKLFEKNNWAVYLDQESMDRNILIEKVYKTWQNKNVISKHLLGITRKGLVNIYNVISKFA